VVGLGGFKTYPFKLWELVIEDLVCEKL